MRLLSRINAASLLLVALMACACTRWPATEDGEDGSQATAEPKGPTSDRMMIERVVTGQQGTQDSPIVFHEATIDMGIAFQHQVNLSSQRHVHLFMGSGVAWIDYDRDDWPDLYFCQASPFESRENENAGIPSNTLLRNRWGDGFTDTTSQVNISNLDFSMGAIVGDFDNDGFDDICVTGYEHVRLYRNCGDGCFQETSLPLTG